MRWLYLVGALFLLGACASTPSPSEHTQPVHTKEQVIHGEPTSAPEKITAVPEPVAEPEIIVPPEPKDPLTVIAVGDIMIGTDFPEDRLPPEDGATSFVHVASILQDADITFGNLEGVLQDGGEPFKVCKNPKLCYLFRTPTRYADYFAQAGFDVMSLANNHARDFGEEGRDSTMTSLDRLGIVHSGREGDIASWTYDRYRLAMIAFAPNPGSYNINDIELAEAMVAYLAQDHDLVFVSFHGGAEGLDALHVTFDNELYYGEERGNVVEFSRRVIDAGADLVIGHGPHVPRGIELYQQRLIAYSLGNFNTYQGISIKGIKGLAPILKVTLNENGEFEYGQIISTRQQRPDGPRIDQSHEAALLIRTLSLEDFPASAPDIDDQGKITPRD